MTTAQLKKLIDKANSMTVEEYRELNESVNDLTPIKVCLDYGVGIRYEDKGNFEIVCISGINLW